LKSIADRAKIRVDIDLSSQYGSTGTRFIWLRSVCREWRQENGAGATYGQYWSEVPESIIYKLPYIRYNLCINMRLIPLVVFFPERFRVENGIKNLYLKQRAIW